MMPTPRYVTELLKPFMIIMGCLFLIVFVYGFFNNEEYEADDTVTITFNCTQVLSNQSNYPNFAIDECKELRRNAK